MLNFILEVLWDHTGRIQATNLVKAGLYLQFLRGDFSPPSRRAAFLWFLSVHEVYFSLFLVALLGLYFMWEYQIRTLLRPPNPPFRHSSEQLSVP